MLGVDRAGSTPTNEIAMAVEEELEPKGFLINLGAHLKSGIKGGDRTDSGLRLLEKKSVWNKLAQDVSLIYL